jgi:hypothetical protein
MFESVPAPSPLQPPPPPAPAPALEAIAAPFRQHVCSICGDSFERKSDLGNHIVCHQVDRPHACRLNNRNCFLSVVSGQDYRETKT